MKIKSRLRIVLAELNMKQQELIDIMKEQNDGKALSNSAMSQLVGGNSLPEFRTSFMILKALRTKRADLHMEDLWIEAGE